MQTIQDSAIVTTESEQEPHPSFRMVQVSVTLVFKFTALFNADYLRNVFEIQT